MENRSYEFAMTPKQSDSIIKVLGVGGGGGNAVNYMYRQGISGVDFVICNTDMQALEMSPVPTKLQIGSDLTSGLGAGANPEMGKASAMESKEQIRDLLQKDTKMVFITAGMGGGTGTGGAPVIAEVARSLGILTVGIVTMPFTFEGRPKARRAAEGIEELKKHCDTVLVILNDRLRDVFGKCSMREAFGHADNVLTRAAKSIAEIITVAGEINVDFEDVRTVMQDAGAAVMGSAIMEGDDRARRAAEAAITSPLLNNTNIFGARYILLSISAGNDEEFQMEELEEITEFVQERAGEDAEIIFGMAYDDNLGKSLSVTVIATGFSNNEQDTKPVQKKSLNKPYSTSKTQIQQHKVESKPEPKEEDDQKEIIDLESEKRTKAPVYQWGGSNDFFSKDDQDDEESFFDLRKSKNEKQEIKFEVTGEYEIIDEEEKEDRRKQDMEERYKERQIRIDNLRRVSEMTQDELKEHQETPAYLRRGVKLEKSPQSNEQNVSRYYLNDDDDVLGDNKFLHDNVD